MSVRFLEWVVLLSGAMVAENPSATAQTTWRANLTWNGAQAAGGGQFGTISADGGTIVFVTDSPDIVLNDTNGCVDVFVREIWTGLTERVSVDSFGAEDNTGWCGSNSISADGRFVAFMSSMTNLVANDTNGCRDVFVHDRVTGTTELVSVDSKGVIGNGSSGDNAISADGRFVAFDSFATNLVANDANGCADVFVHDRVTGVTERVSVDSIGVQGDGSSGVPSISSDGRFVALDSSATNFVANDANGCEDIFVHDRVTGLTECVSVDSLGVPGNAWSTGPSISGDGMSVAFTSDATNLVANDVNNNYDVFVRSRSSGITTCVSVDSSGAQGNGVSWTTVPGAISSDGTTVAFISSATNLVLNDTNGSDDAFVHKLTGGKTYLASVGPSGVQSDGPSTDARISGNGLFAVFTSQATNLVENDTNLTFDVFVSGTYPPANWSNFGAGFPGTNGVASFTSQANPVIGTSLTVDVGNSLGDYTVGALFIGFEQAALHSTWGGDLLVEPVITQLIGLTPWGASLLGEIPNDESLCGCVLELQAIEADPGASKGVSFTPGLELVLGH
jgi:Tol biopolymer transport system component